MQKIVELKVEETKAVIGGNKVAVATVASSVNSLPIVDTRR
jgi:hypothetical protein